MLIKTGKILDFGKKWLSERPEKTLEKAYNSALMLRMLETQHFDGNKIPFLATANNNVSAYFQSELKKHLRTIRLNLLEFEATVSVIDTLDSSESSSFLDKLRFIDEVIVKYKSDQTEIKFPVISSFITLISSKTGDSEQQSSQEQLTDVSSSMQNQSKLDDTSLLPTSIFQTLDMLRKQINPKNEKQLLNELRNSKVRTRVALIFLTMLIVIPFITQQVSKKFLVGPLVEQLNLEGRVQVFLHSELEKEALEDLEAYEKELKFQQLIGETPRLSAEKMEEMVKEKAVEITKEYNEKSIDGVKNLFADVISVGVLAFLVLVGKRGMAALKSLMDDVMYGLSDSAKAFLLIVCTDIFVGFHSSHGWEVLLEGTTKHFGLPENREFIFLFIATFPVILDGVFKYWIFRYLNRMSPSAVATYKNMNE